MKNSAKPETELTSEQIEFMQQTNDIMWSHIANMSHEIRSPATVVTGLSEYMIKNETGALSEKQLQHLDGIHKSSRRLLEIFEYFLTVSRITLFSQEREMEEVILEEVCEEAGLSLNRQNETQTIHHILSDKFFLRLILEVISSLPNTEIKHKINLSVSQNETQVILHITIKYNKNIDFGKNDLRLRSCQIGIRNLGGQWIWDEPEDGKLAIQIALPVFKANIFSSEA